MATMDNRIIQMQFDNAKFERNIAQSQKSIEELKEAMNFDETSRGLTRFSRGLEGLDFSGLTDNLQKLTDKFTGLGDVGEYVISRIRSGFEGVARGVESLIKSISIDQITVGQGKYDALNKSIQTIIADGKVSEKDAYTTMERVMAYTDQTSHSYNTMVGQIAALRSSTNMGLDEAERFLEGIGNASTMAGAGANEAAAAMSLISKVMGGTHLGRQQFDSLNQTYRVISSKWRELAVEAGLQTGDLVKKGDKVFTAAKYGKQVEVTAQQLENTLSKKWFTGDVARILYGNFEFGETINDLKHPEEAMDSLGKTAFLTGQRALTFVDALNAIKESVSSGWVETFRIVLGDLTDAIELFTDACDRVVDSLEHIKEFRNAVFRSWKAGGGRNSLLDILLGDYWRETEIGAVGFMDLIDGLGKMVFEGFRDFLLLFADPTDRYNVKMNPEYFQSWLGARLADITQGVQNFMQRIKAFFNEEIDVNGEAKTRLQVVYEIVQGISGALGLAWMILESVIHFIDRIRAQLQPSIDTIAGFFGDLGTILYGTAEEASDQKTIFNFFDELASKAEPLTSGINKIVEALDKLLRALFGIDENATATDEIKGFGDALLTVADWIGKGIGPILTFIADFIGALTDLTSGKIDFGSFLERIGGAFTDMIGTFTSYLPEDFLPDWLKQLFGLGEESTEEEGNSFFGKLRTFFETNFASFDTLLGNLTKGLSLKNALESGFGFLSAFNFLGTVIGWFKGTNLYNVILAFLGVAALGTLWRLFSQAKKAVKTIGGFFDDVGGNLKAGILGHYEWNSEKVLNFAKGLLMIAGSIALLGSMDRGALIQGTIAVGLIFAALMAFIAVVNSDKFKANYGQQLAAAAVIDAIAAAVVAITLSLSILMLAMIPLASDWKKMLAAFLGFTGILAAIGGFLIIMLNSMNAFIGPSLGGKTNWAGLGKMVIMLVMLAAVVAAISLSIGTLMVAMTPLAAMGWKSVLSVTVAFGLILTAIGTFTMAMLGAMDKFVSAIGGGSTSWSGIGKMAAMMLMLAATVALISVGISVLVIALAPLAVMSPKSILTATVALGLMLAEIGTFIMVMLNQMDQFAFNVGGGKTGAAGIAKMAAMMGILALGVVLLSAGISLLVMAITPLAVMSTEGVVRAVSGLGVILFELGLFMGYLSKIQNGKDAAVKLMSFAGFAFSIGILVMALTPLALMDWGGWGRAMLGLTIVLGELIGAMKLMQVAKVSTASLAAFAGFAASIGILIYTLQPLAGMDWGGWGRAMIGLMIVLGELIGAMKLMEIAKVNTGALVGFIGFALSIAILIYALKPLAEMDQEGYYRALFGLGTVMLEVIALVAIMNELKPNLATAGTTLLMLVGLGASMILFGIAFNEVKDIPVENIIGFAAAIGILLVAVAGAAALAKVGGIKGLLIAIAGIAAVLGVIALMAPLVIGSVSESMREAAGNFAIIGDLLATFSTKMNGVDEGGIAKGGRAVDAIMGLIGRMVGIVFTSDMTKSFMTAVSQLTLAADEMIKFDRKIGSLSADGGTAKAISLLDNYKEMLENHVVGFDQYIDATNGFYSVLFNLGSAFDYFNNMMSSLGEPESNTGFGLIKQLAACAPDLNTIYNMDLDKFRRQLAELGGAMIIYARGAASVNSDGQGINEDTDIGGAIILLRKISESLSQAGGFSIPENMPSDTELTDFGAQLAALAGALVSFEEAGSGLGNGTKEALRTLEFFRDLKQELGTMNLGADLGQAIQSFKDENGEFIGQDELTMFGEDIAKLGSSMAHFAQSTQTVNEETGEATPIDYTKATEALNSIGELANSLPNTGGWAEVVLGKKQGLDDLATNLNLLGDALGEFNTSTSTFDEAQKKAVPMDFTNAITFLNSIGDVQSKLPKVKSFSLQYLFEGENMTLGDLGSELAQLGSGMNAFSEKITGLDENGKAKFDPTSAGAAADLVEQMIPVMQKVGSSLSRIGGIGNFFKTLGEGREATLKDVGDAIGDLGEGMARFGTAVTGKFGNVEDITNSLGVVEGVMGIISHLSRMEGMYVEYGNVTAWIMDLSSFLNGLTADFRNNGGDISVIDNLVLIMEKISEAISMSETIDSASLGIFSSFTEALSNLAGTDLQKITKDFENIGSNIAAGVESGISKGTSGVILAAVNMAVAAYEAACKALDVNSPSKVFTEVGEYIGLGMANGIQFSSEDVVNATEDTVQSIMNVVDKDTIGNWMRDIYSSGNVDLLTRPVIDAQKLAKAGWEDVGDGIATVFSSTFTAGQKNADYEWNQDVIVDVTPITPDGRVLSPEELEDYVGGLLDRSTNLKDLLKNDRTENGGMNLLLDLNTDFNSFDEGLEKAEQRMILLHQLQEGYYSTETGAASALDRVAAITALVSQAMAESTEASPTITPVLDLTQVETQLRELGLTGYGGSIGIDTSRVAGNAGHIGNTNTGDNQNAPDYSGIYERMATLGTQILELGNSISKIKLVLNTGVVAGGVTDGVDANLGRKIFYANRNN